MKRATLLLLAALLSLTFLLAGCGSEKAVVSYFTPGDYIVVNIADSYRLLKVSPVLVINLDIEKKRDGMDVTLEEELTAMQPQIRDTMNTVLRTKDEESLKAAGAQDVIRDEFLQAMVNDLGLYYVTNIYFSDFVIQ